jgi:hypothetical protein
MSRTVCCDGEIADGGGCEAVEEWTIGEKGDIKISSACDVNEGRDDGCFEVVVVGCGRAIGSN